MAAAPKQLWAAIIGGDNVGAVFLDKESAADEANMHATLCLSNAADGAEGEAWYQEVDQSPDMEKVGFPLCFGEGLNFCAPIIVCEEGVELADGKHVFVIIERKEEEEQERDGINTLIAATRVIAFATKDAAEARKANPPVGWDKMRAFQRVRKCEIGKGENYM